MNIHIISLPKSSLVKAQNALAYFFKETRRQIARRIQQSAQQK